MRNDPDPIVHRQRQQMLIDHVQGLLRDERLKVDTTGGQKPVTTLARDVTPNDNGVMVKQRMIELGLFDRDLQRRMPPGLGLDVLLSQVGMLSRKTPIGRMKVITASPVDDLLQGGNAGPMTKAQVQKLLTGGPPPLPQMAGLPQTVVIVSTSGFAGDALALAERRPGGGTVLLVGMNDAGGWTVTAPPGMESVAKLLDPETTAQKIERLKNDIEHSADLLTGGVSVDRLAERNDVSVELAERAMKEYAESQPGLAIRTMEGTLVLYRDSLSVGGDDTGDNMPFWEKVKGVFSRGESAEKKVSRLSQEKALLAQQREKAYAEIEMVERKESDLTASFPNATPLAQKRIATEISQLRKRVERIQQLVATIDKKINIVETGVHNLEMEKHLSKEKLEQLENVATASEQVDVGMATLDQLNEQADAVSVVGTEMSMGANDVLAELQAKFAAEPKAAEPSKAATGPSLTPPAKEKAVAQPSGPPPIPAERRRVPGAAEPG